MTPTFEQDLIAEQRPMGFIGTTQIGRYATRVRISAGAYAGTTGVVVRTVHPEYIEVRLTSGRHAGAQLGFGPSELEAI